MNSCCDYYYFNLFYCLLEFAQLFKSGILFIYYFFALWRDIYSAHDFFLLSNSAFWHFRFKYGKLVISRRRSKITKGSIFYHLPNIGYNRGYWLVFKVTSSKMPYLLCELQILNYISSDIVYAYTYMLIYKQINMVHANYQMIS